MIKQPMVFATILLFGVSAHADTWVMNNDGNGKIVLTDRKCKHKDTNTLYYAYSYTNRVFLEGCWALMDGRVHVVWDKNQGRRVYEMNDFIQDHVEPKKGANGT